MTKPRGRSNASGLLITFDLTDRKMTDLNFNQIRTCRKCQSEKTHADFPVKKNKGASLLSWTCKNCTNAQAAVARYKREGFSANAARLQTLRGLRLAGLKSCKTCGVVSALSDFHRKKQNSPKGVPQHLADCKKCSNAKAMESHVRNRETRLASSRAKRKEDAARLNAKKVEYVRKNRAAVTRRQAEWSKRKRAEDPLFALKWRIRSAISSAFFKAGYSKGSRTEELIGCSWGELKEHLGSQFQTGMTWENRGVYGWHIDHIVPLSSARTAEDLVRLNHFTNLQPLWAEDNIRKADKMPDGYRHTEQCDLDAPPQTV